jgi:RecA/RadA recombinase
MEEEQNTSKDFEKVKILLQFNFEKEIIEELEKNGLDNITDILSSNEEDLLRLKKFDSIIIKDLVSICRKIENFGSLALNMYDFNSQNRLIKKKDLNTVENFLEKFLFGKVAVGQITEFFGEAGSGKTQFCHSLCVFRQEDKNDKIIYIDSEGCFRPENIRKICSENNLDPKRILQNIFYQRVYHYEMLIETVSLLEKFLKNKIDVKLIIIDSIASLFRVDFMQNEYDLKMKLFVGLFSILQNLSYKYKTSIILTNHVYDFIDPLKGNILKPLFNSIFDKYCNLRFKLTKWKGPYKICEIIKSDDHTKKRFKFKIQNKGICKIDPFFVYM